LKRPWSETTKRPRGQPKKSAKIPKEAKRLKVSEKMTALAKGQIWGMREQLEAYPSDLGRKGKSHLAPKACEDAELVHKTVVMDEVSGDELPRREAVYARRTPRGST
jgi:hypothetical protein